MLSENDKELINKMTKEPGWELLKKELQSQADTHRFLAEQPEADEHYRLILFGKAQGIEEVLNNKLTGNND